MIRPLSVALAEKAHKELNEVESRIPDDIDALRIWLKQERHLKTPTDDQFLIAFLRGSKYSLQRAKEKIDCYFSIRQALPEMFLNRDPTISRNLEIIRTGTTLNMRSPMSEDGPLLTIIRPGAYDPKKFTFSEIIRISTINGELLMLEDDNVIIGGVVGILDLANVTMDHFLQLDLNLMKKMTMMSQEGQPFRQKGFHYINTPPTFEKVFNIMKGFLSEKNKSRVFVHSTMESLYKHVPQKLLPADYGGEAESIQELTEYLEKRIMASRDTILEWDKYGTDESKRTKKLKIMDDFYGVEGSFRKLDVF